MLIVSKELRRRPSFLESGMLPPRLWNKGRRGSMRLQQDGIVGLTDER